MKAHITTWALAVLSAFILGAAWVHTHPAPRLGAVDMGALFAEQKQAFTGQIKPGMSEQEQKVLFQSAADYANRLDAALATLTLECGCTLLNSAAILRQPAGKRPMIPDLTERARQLAGPLSPQ